LRIAALALSCRFSQRMMSPSASLSSVKDLVIFTGHFRVVIPGNNCPALPSRQPLAKSPEAESIGEHWIIYHPGVSEVPADVGAQQ